MSQPSEKALEAARAIDYGGHLLSSTVRNHAVGRAIDKAVAEEREENAALVNRMIGCGRAEIAAAIRAREMFEKDGLPPEP